MKLNKRIAAVSAVALLATLALGGAANAADNGDGAAKDRSSHSHTIEAPAGTPRVAGKKIEPASKDNPYSQTVKAPVGTEHTGAGRLADK